MRAGVAILLFHDSLVGEYLQYKYVMLFILLEDEFNSWLVNVQRAAIFVVQTHLFGILGHYCKHGWLSSSQELDIRLFVKIANISPIFGGRYH